MGKLYNEEEKFLLLAGMRYAEKTGMARTKLAWGLASLLGRTDSSVYHKMRDLPTDLEARSFEEIARMAKDAPEEVEEQVLIEEQKQEIADDTLEQHVGELYKVRVVDAKSFGLLCQVEGTTRVLLLHVSEIANEFIDDVGNYARIGDEFLAMLIVNDVNSRIGLSTRRTGSLVRRLPKMPDWYKNHLEEEAI